VSDTEDKPADLKAVQDDVVEYAKPKLKELGENLKDSFIARYGKYVNEADLERLSELTRQGHDMSVLALTAKTEDEARQYAQAIKALEASVATIDLKIAIEEDAQKANFIAEAFAAGLATFKSVAAGVLGIIIKGVGQGVIGAVKDSGGSLTNPSDLVGGVKTFGGSLFGGGDEK